ncbi:MAG: hypothetical protein EOO20_19645, partial [Chryseobacterium sp.]
MGNILVTSGTLAPDCEVQHGPAVPGWELSAVQRQYLGPGLGRWGFASQRLRVPLRRAEQADLWRKYGHCDERGAGLRRDG